MAGRAGLHACVAFLALALALLAPRLAHALAPIEVTSAPVLIGERVEFFRDAQGTATAAEVATETFTKSNATYPNFGFTNDVVWVRFTLHNATDGDLDLALDVAREWVDELDVFEVADGNPTKVFESGTRVPLARRPIPVERMAIPIALGRAETRAYLLRLHTRSPLDVRAWLGPRRLFMEDHMNGELLFGAYYAILLGIGSYSLFLFANLRDRMQAGVAALLFSVALTEITGHGHVSLLLPSIPDVVLRGTILGIAGIAFAVPYVAGLVLPRSAKRVMSVLVYGRSVGVAVCIAALVAPRWSFLALVGLGISLAVSVAACVVALRERPLGDATAIYLSLAVGAFVFPMLVTGGTLFGLLPAFAVNEYGNHAGAVAMSLLLSLLVADSIRTARTRVSSLQVSTEALNDQLSVRVDELDQRAKEVDALNEELRFQVASRSRELVDVLARQAAAATGEPIREGDVFESRYRVLRFLGRGGMGSVHEVERVSDGRHLALKVVTSARTGADAARIAREAEIGAGIAHENLVRILDVGVARQGPYLVMELVSGGSLDGHKANWSKVEWAVPILRGIAAGLDQLHRAKIVHRDLKPANILLDGSTPKVADFGIARVDGIGAGHDAALAATLETRASDESALATTCDATPARGRAELTEAHTIMGTPLYMAPESALGAHALGSAVDVFAFGVMALELLSGEHPYSLDALPILEALARRPHPAHRSATNVSARLTETLDRCLDADPRTRPTFGEILAALEG